ncbi:unnamed protein product [Linum tenue]|uniref:NnrU domain-containing protein n=1 Tax=Linum tenue TaxID=586396 RepID=A0AAV0N3F6_9ROSI|nr:unnamed protein product [Linum tenue]
MAASSVLFCNPLSALRRRPTAVSAAGFPRPLTVATPLPRSVFLRPGLRSSTNLLLRSSSPPRTSIRDVDSPADEPPPVGEDSALFQLENQKLSSWLYFSVILGVVLFLLNLLWIDNSTGYGKAFVDSLSAVFDSHEVVMLMLILVFATVHSGLASLREAGEKVVGERAFRVLFAGLSLPLAVSTVVYFINHRYDGTQLWQLQSVSGMVGQVMWCVAHTVWIGNSVALAASVGLIAHHLFGVWNGDRRLAARHGEAFEAVKERTSVVPFAAILDGRQKLPKDYYKEFLRLPYLTITAVTLGAYFAHPLMQASSYGLHW